MTSVYWHRAVTELSSRDPVLQRLSHQFSEVSLEQSSNAFATLARAIVGQQISVKAAASVWERICTAISDITPSAFMAVAPDLLKNCGLSARKVGYLQDLACHFENGFLSQTGWCNLSDEELIRQLIRIKGIGRWTAEMFLIFSLGRPNVLPVDDLGLKTAVKKLYRLPALPTKADLRQRGELWQPYCSVATWYLWQSLRLE